MSFADAVLSTPEIAKCLKAGLQALRANSSKVKVRVTRDLKGSVDIDTCLTSRYPNASRWDYVFGYKERIYYVEVHQGSVGEVESIIAKFNWLKHWRKNSAKNLEDLSDHSTHHWISTKGTASIGKRSRHHRMLDQNNIYGPYSVLNADTVP